MDIRNTQCFSDFAWNLLSNLVGGWPTHLKNDIQMGWWHSQLNGKTCSNPPTSLLSNVVRRKRTKKYGHHRCAITLNDQPMCHPDFGWQSKRSLSVFPFAVNRRICRSLDRDRPWGRIFWPGWSDQCSAHVGYPHVRQMVVWEDIFPHPHCNLTLWNSPFARHGMLFLRGWTSPSFMAFKSGPQTGGGKSHVSPAVFFKAKAKKVKQQSIVT